MTPPAAALQIDTVQIDTAVVINLPASVHRLHAVRRQWDKHPTLPQLQVFAGIAHSDGAAGCLASHQAVLAAHHQPLLIVEDDIVFADTFTWPISAPADWQLLWLGGQHRTPAGRAVPGWNRPRHLVRTHCYAVRDPQLIAALLADAPRADPYLAALPVTQYAQTPFTVGQSAGRSDITGRHRSTDTYWNC